MTTTVLPWSRRSMSAVEEHLDVGEVQARRRLVEHVERAAGRLARELARELHALRFAARERRRRLAERDVAEADLAQRLEPLADARDGLEQLERLLHRRRRARRRWTGRGTSPRASRGCSACPPHVSHVTKMSGRKCISTRSTPSPWHASQRPPFTLNEKRPAL